MSVTQATLKALFARSGNRCAFPECDQKLMADDNLFIGQICHIHAAMPGGPRYDPNQSDADRDGYDNLILLCYPHHKRVDGHSSQYRAEKLRGMKAKHEEHFLNSPYILNTKAAAEIEKEEQSYWSRLRTIRKELEKVVEHPSDANLNASHGEVIEELEKLIDNLEYLAGRASSREMSSPGPSPFEALNIYIPNNVMMGKLYLRQLAVQFLACRAKLHPMDENASADLEKAKAALTALTEGSGYID